MLERKLLVFGLVGFVLSLACSSATAQTYTDLHNFQCADGCRPKLPTSSDSPSLAQGRDGNLFGTMSLGGANNFGTVFRVTPGGGLTTLHNLDDVITGRSPYGGVTIASDGNLYGTASEGGANGWGTIFRITASGVLTVMHGFDFLGNAGRDPHIAPIQASNGPVWGDRHF